jgi:hypothetical protein
MKLSSKIRLTTLPALLGATLFGLTSVASAAPTVVYDRYFDLDRHGGCEYTSAWLGYTSDRFCTLNGVKGKFEGYGEYGMVYRSGAYWYFAGNSCQSAVEFRVTCFR